MAHVVQDTPRGRRTAMGGVDGKVVIVTGAASGIGRATAAGCSPTAPPWSAPTSPTTADDLGERWTLRAHRRHRRGARCRRSSPPAVEAGGGRIDGTVTAAGVAGGGPAHLVDADRVAARHRHQPHRHVPRGQARHRPAADPGAASTASAARSSPSPASRASRAPPAAAPTTRRRAAWCCSPRTWPSTTGPRASA